LTAAYASQVRLSALDIYAAAALGVFRPLSDEWVPLHPRFRKMLESAADYTNLNVLPELLEHREFIYRRHIGGPSQLQLHPTETTMG